MTTKRPRRSPWQPLERWPLAVNPELAAAVDASPVLSRLTPSTELWRNDRYSVLVSRYDSGDVQHLSVKRADRKPIHDWRDLQRIKNEIAGPEAEAVELYPAMSRLVDGANQYHLWVFPVGTTVPIGFPSRLTVSQERGEQIVPGIKQRDLPPDWEESVPPELGV